MNKKVLHTSTVKPTESGDSIKIHVPIDAKKELGVTVDDLLTLRVEEGIKGKFMTIFKKEED